MPRLHDAGSQGDVQVPCLPDDHDHDHPGKHVPLFDRVGMRGPADPGMT